MKAVSSQRERIKSVLCASPLSEDYKKLLSADLKKLLCDYFEQPQAIDIAVTAAKGGYEFVIRGCALRLKTFNKIY